MAKTGLMFSDDGKTLTVKNVDSTNAIYAGDIVYSRSTVDSLGGTFASARTAYEYSDVGVGPIKASATGYQLVVGVAVTDIAASGYGTIAMEGVFIHTAQEAIVSGGCVQGYEGTANKLMALDTKSAGTQAVTEYTHKIGKALIGTSAGDKLCLWKLNV
jgi:hypothetical protein